MAGSDAVFRAINTLPGTRYPVLVPNLQGLERALNVGATEISIFVAASESFSQRNINCSIAESLQQAQAVIERAKAQKLRVRAYISCVLGCPYEGDIPSDAVVAVSEQLMLMGSDEISLGDTIGTGTPAKAHDLITSVAEVVDMERLAVHFHDTYGQALANILACLDAGIRIVDASVSGLGGCPYATGASGNVATEDVVYMLHGLGLETGIDLQQLANTGNWISNQLKRPNNSKAGVALISRESANKN